MSEHEKKLLELLAQLSSNPADSLARLQLAKVFFELNFVPFAAREVRDLILANPTNDRLKRLLERLDPGSVAALSVAGESSSSGNTLAEADFDMQDLEDILEEK